MGVPPDGGGGGGGGGGGETADALQPPLGSWHEVPVGQGPTWNTLSIMLVQDIQSLMLACMHNGEGGPPSS